MSRKARRSITIALLSGLFLAAIPLWAGDPTEQLFNDNCASCHGKRGDAKTAYAKRTPTADLRSKEVQSKSDEALYGAIGRGTGHVNYPHGYEMRGMSKEKIFSLIQYIRALK